jgi:hypothetical protein
LKSIRKRGQADDMVKMPVGKSNVTGDKAEFFKSGNDPVRFPSRINNRRVCAIIIKGVYPAIGRERAHG